jgi:initiation factor 1A
MLGNGRCECYCFDGKNRLAHIRGKMRKKVWVSAVSAVCQAHTFLGRVQSMGWGTGTIDRPID